MTRSDWFRSSLKHVGVEGILFTLSPIPFLFYLSDTSTALTFSTGTLISALASVLIFSSGILVFRHQMFARITGTIALLLTLFTLFTKMLNNPFLALWTIVAVTFAGFSLLDYSLKKNTSENYTSHEDRCRQRALWSALCLPLAAWITATMHFSNSFYLWVFAVIPATTLILYLHWSWTYRKTVYRLTGILLLTGYSAILFSVPTHYLIPISLIFSIIICLVLNSTEIEDNQEHYWKDLFLNHPARLLLTFFFVLSAVGTLLLLLPFSTTVTTMPIVDAMFTSVSAVCVTGLIVLDTPVDFSQVGQIIILILIQLGGLGIMSMTAVALQWMGRRLSLKQERVLVSITETEHKSLADTLKIIVKFTFTAELIGAATLSFMFHTHGEAWNGAVFRGVFTSVSAFCNAGFALQSDSLIPYQTSPIILSIVSFLIISGGIAPVTSLLIPRFAAGKHIPVAAKIVLTTTVVMLISGTLFFLAFEWDGALSGLSIYNKISNAWFQSVTLRTAGFNSVDISGVSNPTFMMMLLFMFVGGSPGGTAGGVKTSTFAVLILTFWAGISQQQDIVIQNRRLNSSTVYKAIAIVFSGALILFFSILMLETTQQIPARMIVFESASAIGTVGLSLGGTAFLDEVGKLIIVLTMFAGRLGPMVMFMLLSRDIQKEGSRCPDIKISLT